MTRRSLASERLHIRYNTVIQLETWTIRLFVLGFCFWLYTKGTITLGDIVVYNMYVGQLIGIALGITGILPALETGRESATALTELLAWCDHDHALKTTQTQQARIQAKHLTFQYENAPAPIIRDFLRRLNPTPSFALLAEMGRVRAP